MSHARPNRETPRHRVSSRWKARATVAACFAFTASGLAACSGPVGDDSEPDTLELAGDADIGVAASAIVNGKLDSSRPVGIFTPTGLSRCSATLISPSYFLTAGTCAHKPGQSIVRTGTFALGPNTFKVVNVVSFNGVDGIFNVALGALETSVPAAVATPARIADHVFEGSETVTETGYGCTQRGGADNANSLRYSEHTESGINVMCGSDRGGGLFRGALAEKGPLVGINSHNTGGQDHFGHPTQYKKRIPGIMRSLSLGLEPGLDRPGSDFSSFSTPNNGLDAWACAQACEQDGRCKAFSLDDSNHVCFLKNAVSPIVPKAGIFSGMPSPKNAFERPGNGYSVTANTTADNCLALCANDKPCAAYSFRDGTCTLSKTVPAAASCPAGSTCTSGVRRGFEVGFDRPGRDFKTTTETDEFACSVTCAKTWNCFAFTFNPTNKKCFLKNEVPAPVANADGISGVRMGLEERSMRIGDDYRHTDDLETVLPEECQALCSEDPACKTWTYFAAEAETSPFGCHLSSNLAATGTTGIYAISGIRGAEFF